VNSLTAASKGGRQRTVAAARGVTSDPNFHMRPPRITDRSQIKNPTLLQQLLLLKKN
jgi:hypothetical protein